jgi:hypothetical protein
VGRITRQVSLTENPRVGGSIPPLGTIPVKFHFTINDLGKVGHSRIPWWDSHSFCPCFHFSMALAASILWRAPLV